jgi:transposase
MKFIQGQDRTQTHIFPVSLDATIDSDNEVRTIDMFVDSLQLKDFGFRVDFPENGRPAYHPSDILKLYIYGYLNKIRSSRDLEKESKRNIEVMWLLNSLQPDHNTISNFRRDNPEAIKKVFRATVQMAKHFKLIGGRLLAGDSSKFRAQNSKKNNFNQQKIHRHTAYIDNKLDEYNKKLSEADGDQKQEIEKDIDKQKKRKDKYQQIEKQLKETGEVQVSTSDPESRQMMIRNHISEVAYNVQTTVDAKYNIPIDYKVTNTNDSKAMGNMLQRAKTILRTNEFTALYDKGYHTGSEFDLAEKLGIEVMVAIPAKSGSSQAPDPAYNMENFVYDEQTDCYTCPEGHTMTTNGNWHKSKSGSMFQQYKTRQCKHCPVRPKCTKSAENGKVIQRRKYAQNIEDNRLRIENNPTAYKKRQAIVEHPYGTIKRQWGFSYISTKKYKKRASADVGLMFVAYNFRRIMNILGQKELRKYLVQVAFSFSGQITEFGLYLKPYNAIKFIEENIERLFNHPLKRLKFDQLLIKSRCY